MSERPSPGRVRLQRRNLGYWGITGTELYLNRNMKWWYLWGGDPPTRSWVIENRVHGPFKSRGDLLTVLKSAWEASPPPPSPSLPRLKRASAGLYLSECGRMRAERRGSGGWLVNLQPEWDSLTGAELNWHAATLAIAAQMIASYVPHLREAG